MSNNLAAFNSESWSARLVTKVDQINVMLPLVNRAYEGDLRNNKTVHVRTPGTITMGSYSRGGVISYQDLIPTTESFTVNDGEYFAFDVDDLDKAQSDVNAMDVYLKRAVIAMNNTVEAKLLATYPSAGVQLGAATDGTGCILTPVIGTGTLEGQIASVTVTAGGSGYTATPAVYFVGGTGNGAAATVTVSGGAVTSIGITSGGNNYYGTGAALPIATLTSKLAVTLTSSAGTATDAYACFCQARSTLSKANVPATSGARWAVVDPDTVSLLLQDDNHFVRAGELGDKVVQYGLIGGEEVARTAAQAPGFVGMIAGFSVYETPHVPIDGNGNRRLLFGDNEAISYAAQITEIEALRLQTTFANAIRGLLLHDTFVSAEMAKRLISLTVSPNS